MPTTDPSGKGLDVHSVLSRLLSPGVESSVFKGYIGPSHDDDTIRVYPSLGMLQFSIEIRRDDVVDTEPAPTTVLPYGGTVLWVRNDAEVVVHGDQVTTVPVRTLQRVPSTRAGASDTGKYVDIERGRLRMSAPADRLGPGARMCDPGCWSCRNCVSSCDATCMT